jgi:Uma2 family endonuclease
MSSVRVADRRKGSPTQPVTEPAVCVVRLYDQEVRIPSSAHTFAGFRAWSRSDEFPDKGRICFIQGEIIIDMSGDELQTHNEVKSAITYTVYGLNQKQDLGKLYVAGAQIANETAAVSNQPEGCFCSWEALESGRVRLIPREGEEGQYIEVEGTPDWVMEVVSDSSVREDTRQLRIAYHAAGIPEYWLIDARGEEIRFEILWHTEAEYVAAPEKNGWHESRVFKRKFRLQRRRGRLGLWQYTLQMKPLR